MVGINSNFWEPTLIFNKGETVHSGAIDDNGAEPNKVTEPYVANAVDALVAGKPMAQAVTGSVGCAIHFRK